MDALETRGRRGRAVDLPAADIGAMALDQLTTSAPARQRARVKVTQARKRVTLTVSGAFADRLHAVAHTRGMHVGAFVEGQLARKVDELLDTTCSNWGYQRRPTSSEDPSPDAQDAA